MTECVWGQDPGGLDVFLLNPASEMKGLKKKDPVGQQLFVQLVPAVGLEFLWSRGLSLRIKDCLEKMSST